MLGGKRISVSRDGYRVLLIGLGLMFLSSVLEGLLRVEQIDAAGWAVMAITFATDAIVIIVAFLGVWVAWMDPNRNGDAPATNK